jgi:photosystem II stability/assembly factor-like uncharacterized protein
MSRKMIRRLLPWCGYVAAVTMLGFAAWAFSVPVNDWSIAGPFGGTARSLAIDPQKPDVVLAGGMNSLVFRSQDAGQNWKLLDFPKRNLSEVTSLLVDPADSDHYLAGVISAEDGGLFESHDAGATWKAVKSMNKFGVRALTFAASKPSEFIAGTLQGVWLSENSGKDWRHISDSENLEMQGITAVAVDTKNPDLIYAGTTHLPWKTSDHGKTWQSIHTGMVDDSDVFSIFVDPLNPSSVLASACSGIYSSEASGDAWKKLMGIPNTSRRTHVIREDPASASTIFAGTTTGLFKSLNHGISWKSLTDNQVNSMVFDPSHPGTLYLALEYEGIGKSLNGGDTITPVNNGFVDRSISSFTRSGDKFFAIETQEGETSGLFASTDRGQTWSRFQAVRGLGGVHLKTIAGAPGNSNILLAASPHQMYKSVDSGNSWRPLPVRLVETPPPAPAKPVTAPSRTARHRTTTAAARSRRPVKPAVKVRQVSLSEISALYSLKLGEQDVFFAATDLGLLKSMNAGEQWTAATIPGSPAVSALYSAPDGSGHFIARTALGLFVSKDCGDHWETLPFPLSPSDVNEIAIAPGKSPVLMAATRLGLYSSPDDGAKWYANLGGIPASTVNSVIFSNQEGLAYAVEYGRLYKTTDAGAAWTPVPTALPGLRIRQLWLPDFASGRLYGITGDLGILFRETGIIR